IAAIASPCSGRAGSRQHPIQKYLRTSNAGLRSLSRISRPAGTCPSNIGVAAPPGNGHALREQLGEQVRVVDLPYAGHFLLLEQPEAVARAVSEFLGQQRSRLMTPQ